MASNKLEGHACVTKAGQGGVIIFKDDVVIRISGRPHGIYACKRSFHSVDYQNYKVERNNVRE